ncbi:MAG: methylenetetrahydrofolate reductase C-terminal domain-containing protein [Bryobacterales bacterium]|nr:methylenetetrahydrofolate reductase C-terminal domain-containing protein [Bryobacterales bacterium]MBV9396844.1 methylenetetrahydrofolate reductase C-terminal domain-containing protein [Bryobacterales bacterium]
MPGTNSIREALAGKKFAYMVELVASRLTREAKVFETASRLAQVPEVVAASITSYAGGSLGHDPIRIGTAVRARGLTPNIHLTCVGRDRLDLRRALEDLNALGIENVFAISGDYPLQKRESNPGPHQYYDFDSVQLVEAINELRQQGLPFHISVAVSPFKYTEADCVYQYLKLEKKIAAGADFAITQLGYDSRKFRELKRYLDERGLKTPVFGSVYILPAKAAEKFSKGEPPGCWVSQELLERIQKEAKAPDKGLAARLERGARMVAILRGLGYAGAYFGGEHDASRIRWMIRRSEEIAGRWEEFAEEISYGKKDGFYFYESAREKKTVPLPMRIVDKFAEMFPVKKQKTGLRSLLSGIFGWIDRHPVLAQGVERAELMFKQPVFGCQACGNCVLGEMEYVCPMTCPKNMRNGPCGGTFMGQCEVLPDRPCIWVKVYDHAKAAGRIEQLKTFVPARNRMLQGTSSFINLFLDRDNRPGHFEPLISISPAPAAPRAEAERPLVKA